MDPLSIRRVLELIPSGQLRVPAFQRGFVWDPDKVAFLMDSIYKRYPFGSLLLWRTRERLRHERALGPFMLPENDPDFPVDYVLDGQQRLTAIFGVFQLDLEPNPEVEWKSIYFDLDADGDAQESQCVALDDGEIDARRHFPLRTLFQTVAYRRATENFGDKDVQRIDEVQSRFKEATIPFELLTTEDRPKVAIVFERINRSGVPLDTLQLLTAWTWSEDFHLQGAFEVLRDELAPFGFAGVGEDSDLLLRCCAAVLASDASPATLVSLRGSEVRARFAEITGGLKGAIDFLRNNLSVETIENLPFSTLLVPLCAFFASADSVQVRVSDQQRRRLLRWFWRSCFSRRFSSGVLRNLKEDIVGAKSLREGRANSLGDFPVNLPTHFFLMNSFRINSVNAKSFILMLAQAKPRSFVSGQPVALASVLRAYNRAEFHHIYPQSFLADQKVGEGGRGILANFCFLSRADNNTLGGEAPSRYRLKMPSDVGAILRHAMCPDNLFSDDYNAFLTERSKILESGAAQLIEDGRMEPGGRSESNVPR